MTDTGLVGTIRETCNIKGRGRVLVLAWGAFPVRIKLGDVVEIHLPGGRVLNTRLAGIGTRCGGNFDGIDILLPKEMDAMEIPPGAEVWRPA